MLVVTLLIALADTTGTQQRLSGLESTLAVHGADGASASAAAAGERASELNGKGPGTPRPLARTLHVSVLGIDGGDGTPARPFTTVQQCVDAAAAAEGPTVCRVGPGRYRGGVVASPRYPLTIIGAGVGVTTFDGTEPVPDVWHRSDTIAANRPVFATTLPPTLRGPMVRQAFVVPNATTTGSLLPKYMSEARWPNAGLTSVLSLGAWAVTSSASQKGVVVDEVVPGRGTLAATGVDFTGARATLNVGDRFTTYTRTVLNHTAGSNRFEYDARFGPGPGSPPSGSFKWGEGGRYWLSGVLAGLDTPGEWHLDRSTWVLSVWAPDSAPPGDRIALRTRDYCVDAAPVSAGAPVTLANASFHACTWRLRNCSGCAVRDVDVVFASYDPEIRVRDVPAGVLPNVTLLHGNDSVVERAGVRWSNSVGIKVAGFRNTLRDVLVQDVDWLATLDFPAIELGFGVSSNAGSTVAESDTVGGAGASAGAGSASSLRPPLKMFPRDPYGEGNVVTMATVRRFGNAGIVTSQLANEISFSHVYDGGLVGTDDACVHADNTYTTCQNLTLPLADRANCTKVWHHNWVHDCREKCMRGDDYTVGLSGHHNVIWNCAMGSTCNPRGGCDRNDGHGIGGSGWLVKGDNNSVYATTIFNVSADTQGSLVIDTTPLPDTGRGAGWPRQNIHSVFLNSLAYNVSGKNGVQPGPATVAVYRGMVHGNSTTASDMGLADPDRFNFSLLPNSPLRRAGAIAPPWAPAVNGGERPDVGAYQTGEPYWVPGCRFSPDCRP